MRELFVSVSIVASGIILAVLILAGAWLAVSPAAKVQVSLADYSCVTDGKAVKCVRK